MEALRTALGRFIGFLPDLVAGLIVLAVGLIIAGAIRRGVLALMPRLGFDRFLVRHRLSNHEPEEHTGSRALGNAAFWLIALVTLMQAANIWRLEFVARGLARVIGYVPNLIAAALIFGVALWAGNWVRDRLRTTESTAYSPVLPGAVRAGILTVGVFMALRQLYIAPEILVIAFTLVFGAIAVAAAIAFGLGGRHTVERMSQDWYENRRRRQADLQSRAARRLDEELPGRQPGSPH